MPTVQSSVESKAQSELASRLGSETLWPATEKILGTDGTLDRIASYLGLAA